ncbi:MAG: 2Fe-2S iron-sulfur cluster binding domain-containing protein, partial [Anaerolineaceae bacterium]|nr:2Fe-2S iron-sulfur cluster binding domain-containing protein [Anaerolineaceae bacterium]
MIQLNVNGKQYAFEPVPGEMLSSLLRKRLHLTGTKIGCDESECGACTVLIDGKPILSCTYPAVKAHGRSVVTIEGLAQWMENTAGSEPSPRLHPLQEAFIQHGAVQCGFCIPGQIMTAYALLLRNQDPSEEEIRHALKDTLCRCAGYPSIIGAIRAAAQAIRSGEPVQPPQVTISAHPGRVVGQAHIRPDAVAKVTGEALFSDDLIFDGMLHARVKR